VRARRPPAAQLPASIGRYPSWEESEAPRRRARAAGGRPTNARDGYAPTVRTQTPDELATFLELPLVAVLATYRRDGTVLLSPVWHEWSDGGFTVATTAGDVKVRHITRDPRASILVAESEPPYRGIEIRCRPSVLPDPGGAIALRLAIRYLGEAEGTEYAETLDDNTLIRLRPDGPDEIRAWDFADDFPPGRD